MLARELKNANDVELKSKTRRRIVATGFALLQHDPLNYVTHHVDSFIWNICYYKEISSYRQQPSMSSDEYLLFLKDAVNNYEYILSSLKKSKIPEHAACSYPILIHVGDLYRYQYIADNENTDALLLAEKSYSKAVTLEPSKGDAYHQLAVLATYKKSYCKALYYCIRVITCSIHSSTAFTNLRYYFVENQKGLNLFIKNNPTLNKRCCNQCLLFQFVECCYNIYSCASYDVFLSSLKHFEHSILWCLERSKPSSVVMMRMLVIAIFGAEDRWLHPEKIESGISLTTSSGLCGWILLMTIVTALFRTSAIPSRPSKQCILMLTHVSSICLFLQWYNVKKPSLNVNQIARTGVNDSLYQEYELIRKNFWKELFLFRKRLPVIQPDELSYSYTLSFELDLSHCSLFSDCLQSTNESANSKQSQVKRNETPIIVFRIHKLVQEIKVASKRDKKRGESLSIKRLHSYCVFNKDN